jgi:hypothetical protein
MATETRPGDSLCRVCGIPCTYIVYFFRRDCRYTIEVRNRGDYCRVHASEEAKRLNHLTQGETDPLGE